MLNFLKRLKTLVNILIFIIQWGFFWEYQVEITEILQETLVFVKYLGRAILEEQKPSERLSKSKSISS